MFRCTLAFNGARGATRPTTKSLKRKVLPGIAQPTVKSAGQLAGIGCHSKKTGGFPNNPGDFSPTSLRAQPLLSGVGLLSKSTVMTLLSSDAALKNELEALLAESRDAAIQRESSAFDRVAGPFAKSLVLFGAGGLGRKTLKGLRQAGIEPLAFADNNSKQWHQKIDGLEILPPEEAVQRYGKSATFVVTIWRAGGTHRFDKTQAQLQQLGCACVVPTMVLFWKFAETFLDYYCVGGGA